MNVIVNLVEIASEMAHRELILQACIEYKISEGEAEGLVTFETFDEVRYKEKYQDKFNEYYDQYYDSVLAISEPVEE
jgi:hypothetical protein